MEKKWNLALSMAGAVILVLVLYIFVHESGHLIVMLSAGAVIDDFSILTAHVSSHGGVYTDVSEMWMNANGAFLPYVTAVIYMLFYKKDSKSIFYKVFSLFAGVVPVSSMLAWVVIPFVYMQGNAPAGDDVTKFLNGFSQYHSPLIVSAAALLLVAIGIVVMIRKQIIQNYYREISEVKKAA